MCFSQTIIYEKARKYTMIFFILQIFRFLYPPNFSTLKDTFLFF